MESEQIAATRLSIDMLCKPSRQSVSATPPRSPLAPNRTATTVNSPSKRWPNVANRQDLKRSDEEGVSEGLFTVGLMVAAVGEGEILADGSRKTRDVLENISRFVSKEQNTTALVAGQGKAIEIKMRVFVQNSIEAKAVTDYISRHPSQKPAAFVLLVENLEMAVMYQSDELDPSSAAVADRLRKQAKTRAVRLVREAIACPTTSVSTKRPVGPVASLEAFIRARSAPVRGGASGRQYVSFNAKSRPHEPGKAIVRGMPPLHTASASSSSASASLQKHGGSKASSPVLRPLDPSSTALFPVSLFVTAIADGVLARDTQQKAKERLGLIITKIPKEQNTTVELKEGTLELKMRVFVANSEDAKAVAEYIQTHSTQVPAPFVILARELPMALLYDAHALDLTDASVADRLRKQAKTRAVKLIREMIADGARSMGTPVLRGYHGATAVSDLLAPLIAAKTRPVEGQPPSVKYLAFAARTKVGPSPYTSPNLPATPSPPSPPSAPLAYEADDEERLCIGALRSLARHSLLQGGGDENGSSSLAARMRRGGTVGGKAWWDLMDTIPTLKGLMKRQGMMKSQGMMSDGEEEEEEEEVRRDEKPVNLVEREAWRKDLEGRGEARGSISTVQDNATTLWHICRECSGADRAVAARVESRPSPMTLPALKMEALAIAVEAPTAVGTKRAAPEAGGSSADEESKAARLV